MIVICPKCKSSVSVIPIIYGYPSRCDECRYKWVKNKPDSGYSAQSKKKNNDEILWTFDGKYFLTKIVQF